MTWTAKIGQGSGIRTQERITDIIVKEEWAHVSFSVTVQNPTSSERLQAKGKIDDAIIQIGRGSDILIEGFIEDVENGADYVRYIGRSFLVMLGYSTNSTTASSGVTNAEYSNATGKTIATDLIEKFCYYVDGDDATPTIRDHELTYSDIDFTENFGGDVKLHGRKVYDIIRDMCNMYAKDLWSNATWNNDISWETSKAYSLSDFVSPTTPNDYAYECTTAGTSGASEPTWGTTVGGTTNDGTAVWTCRNLEVNNKNIHIGTKTRGSSISPHKTLYGGQHLKNIPVVKYRTQGDMVNCLRVIGKGSGKDRVSVWCQDDASVAAYGYIEGSPFISNMIADEDTAKAIGDAIIADKKDPVEQLHVDLIYYINDLKYGDWVKIVDSYSNIDTTKRIKSVTRTYNSQIGDSMKIEVGSVFNNYELIIADLTKKDVDNELEMTKLDGALTLTANDPPSNFIRCSGGDYYDSTGTIQTAGKGVCGFWSSTIYRLGGSNPVSGSYKKALVMIKDSDLTIWYRVGTEYTSKTDAEVESISCDAGYMPLGEVILKGKGDGEVENVYSSDSDYSYIYRDARPIVGSSSAGYGGDVQNPLTEDLSAAGLYSITHLISLDGTYNSTTGYDELYIRNEADDFDIAMFGSSGSGETASGFLDMLDHHIANVLAADDVAHAVNLGQLGYADPSGWVAGDLLYASDSNHLTRLAKGEATQVLTMNAGATAPEWAAGGSGTFTGLSDTPTDYTGAAGKYVRVNSVPDGLEFADGSGGVTDHALLTNLDYAHAGHTGFAPTAHTHAWGDITSGVPDYCTRWAAWSDVSSKPDLLYTDGSNHMTGDLNFTTGSYVGKIDLDSSGNLIFSRGLNTPSTALTLASEENILYANLNMSGAKITGIGAGTAASNDAARMANLDAYMLIETYDSGGDGVFDIPVGGTGISTFATGDILYASATDTLARLTALADGKVLTLSGGVPAWADATGGVTAHSDLTQLDFPSCGHSGTLAQLSVLISDATLIDTNDSRLSDARTPTAHTHAWGDITSGVPDYCTRWAAWSDVSSKPDLLYTDGSNHMTGDLNFWNGSYRAYIKLNTDGHFSFYQGLDTATEVLTLTSEENIMYADLVMSGHSITSCPNIEAAGTTGYMQIVGGSSHPGAMVAYGEAHSDFPGDVRLYVPNAAKSQWAVGLIVHGVSDAPIVEIPYGLDMNNTGKITSLVAGTESGEAVERGQLDSYLPLAGGTMGGNLILDDGTDISPELSLKAGTVGAYLMANASYLYIKRISDDALLARCTFSSKDWAFAGKLMMTGGVLDMRGNYIYGNNTAGGNLYLCPTLDTLKGNVIIYESDLDLNIHNIINVGGITMFSEAGVDMNSGALSSVGSITMVKGEHLALGDSDIAYIYQDATTNALKFYDTVLNAEKTLSELAAGGTFTGLSDTPTDYTGAAGKYVRVNSVPDGLEFADIGSTYWEVISSALVPIGYDIIQGRDTYDLYIKPASGKILYLG